MSSTHPSSSDWEPPLPEDLQRLLPQYEITGILGRGGMGAVYKGRQAKLDRVVAIKLLPETFSKGEDDLNFAARFLQEARAMARLDHPGIISVYDFGETSEGQLYFVMEFIDGMDIHQYLKSHGGTLPQESAVSIAAHVLDALDYAHSQGIVHRDIKPANIMLNRAGRVKVADFGLAKRFGEEVDPAAPALTMSNVAVGTPDFVAPEALDSEATPDHRADLYAVGVMLYQLLTGRLPRGMFQMPGEMRPELDPRLDGIVEKAMAANPDYRYQNAAEMRADLQAIFTQPLAKVEPGTDSGEVPAAVPVTRTVRGSTGVKTKPAKSTSAPAPKAPSKRDKTGLILGLSVAAAVSAGLGVFWAFGPKRGATVPPAPAPVAKTNPSGPAQTSPVKAPEPPATIPAAPVVAKKDDPPAAPSKDPGTMPAPAPANPVEGKAPSLAPAPPLVAKADPPAPMPAPAPDPALPPPSPHAQIASLPGLKTRLDGYHAARAKQLGELAGKYLGGLESRLNQAADAGDLKLATAFGEEKARIEALMKTLATPPVDPLVAAADRTAPLADLAEGSPEALATLRQTWTTESDKIRVALDAALQQSLQALESELTKARDFEKAKGVLAYRESLGVTRSGDFQSPGVTPATASGTPSPAVGSKPPVDLARATKSEPFTNSLGMKFVPVPDTEILLCIHETRKGDYAKFAAENLGEFHKADWKNPTELGVPVSTADDHPVVNVSWDNAKSFCDWLSQKEGRAYRLPTDREWSVAVGIAKEEKEGLTPEELHNQQIEEYSWGNKFPIPRGAGNYGDTALKEKLPNAIIVEGYTDGFATTAPVMSFRADRQGLFDLGGNVSEWCEDWHNADQTGKVTRGSAWGTRHGPAFFLSHRGSSRSDIGWNYLGFRCALVISPANAAPGTTPAATLPAAPTSAPPSAAKPATPDPVLSRATKDAPFTNTLGMKFVPVPGTDILLCIHETRKGDYAKFADGNPKVKGDWKNPTVHGVPVSEGDDHPVVSVSWNDAKAFCDWLSQQEGRTYRLPTDREWSVAVGIGRDEKEGESPESLRGKLINQYPWGTEWPPPKGAGNYSDTATKEKIPTAAVVAGYTDGYATTAPVMSFKVNRLGLYDLSGNVWEWCEDWINGEQKDKVKRGGGWDHGLGGYLNSSGRQQGPPGYGFPGTGFRCALVISAVNAAPGTAPAAAVPPAAPAAPNSMPPSAAKPAVSDPVLARATKDAPFANTLGMKFVPLPDTSVLFCIHETRMKDYAAYIAETPGTDTRWDFGPTQSPPYSHGDDHPVTHVNWADARVFCDWLSKVEGRAYRLPTDREWSIAAGIDREESRLKKAGDTPSSLNSMLPDCFPWKGGWPPPNGAGNFADDSAGSANPSIRIIPGYSDGFPTTSPVMSFKPNSLGIYDLGGNVSEWCEDWSDASQKTRTIRGSGWADDYRKNLFLSYRSQGAPDTPNTRIRSQGFRVVLDTSAPDPTAQP